MNILGQYKNGNYNCMILSDGTKIRYNNLDDFSPVKPESMDLKITNKCYGNGNGICRMCHERSTPEGKHGDILNLPFIDTLLPYSEIAVGGGDVLLHPDLIPFLKKLKRRKIIANMTVNQWNFEHSIESIEKLVESKLIYGLGVSLNDASDEFIKKAKRFPNLVVHVINGMTTIEQLEKLSNNGLKILILGYKQFGRGIENYSNEHDSIEELKEKLYDKLPEIIDGNWFDCVSFDNLAIEQLNPKRTMSDDDYKKFFMGDDGFATMYIDAVERKFAKSSTSTERYDILDDIKDMFDIVKEV